MKSVFEIGCRELTISDLSEFLKHRPKCILSEQGRKNIQSCRDYLDQKVTESTEPLYGITTGFGSLCNRSISCDELSRLQSNLIKSHACSCGNPVDKDIIRLMLLLKAHALSLGYSGVQVLTVERILDLLNSDALPVVYDMGSLGASGDLAPLANLFLPLIGEGELYYKGEKRPATQVLTLLGLEPIELKSKEGLALLNGTQFMSSHGVYSLIRAKRLLEVANVLGAFSLEAFNGLADPFSEELHRIRPHRGQEYVSSQVRALLCGSTLQQSAKPYVQDPYSFRCIPQVHGATYDTLSYVTSVVEVEINSVTDNPTIFQDSGRIISGGNFHGQPLALVYDFLAIAMAELGNISERRVAQLILGQRGLPEFLVAKPGLNSGLMIPQYAAASLVSRNKMYCYGASSDSIVSSNGQEDHVSMGANAATKLLPLMDNLELIFGIELLNASQALDLLENGSKTSVALQRLHRDYRRHVPMIQDDTVMYCLIEKSAEFVRRYDFSSLCCG